MTDIPHEQSGETLGFVEPLDYERGITSADELSDDEAYTITRRLGGLALDHESVLRDHQIEAFEDIVEFFRDGGREGYVQLPTSTGKTVLFIEICKQLVASSPESEDKPRSIVLVPTIDLANQTLGSIDPETGKRRGFRGFAPELNAKVYHSKIKELERKTSIAEADVLITTYDSFRNLVKSLLIAETKTPDEWQAEKTKLLDQIEDYQKNYHLTNRMGNVFMEQVYLRQEVARIRQEALKIKGGDSKTAPSTADKKNIDAILDITDPDKQLSDKDRVMILDRKTRLIARQQPRIKDTLTWRSEKQKAEREKARGKLDYKAIGENEVKDLTTFENMIISYVWRHAGTKKPLPSDLLEYEDRIEAYSYVNRAREMKNNYSYAQTRINHIDYMLDVYDSVSRFSLIVADEAHRSIGSETWEAIRNFALDRDIAILGLTATDKYFDRSLEDFFEKKIHELTKQEAMKREIVNPVSMFVHETGMRFTGVGLDPNGDYDRYTIRSMRFNEERNMIGVNYARILSENGYHGLMPCIPGDKGAHAKEQAARINQTLMIDPVTGEQRYMRAKYILQDSINRDEYYKAMEKGEIDWFTFTDVIREGYDSDKVKALINMRPVRSPLLATQRLGRIGRTYDGAPVSIAIDLFDGIEGEDSSAEIPPVLAADVFGIDLNPQGYIEGSQKDIDIPVIKKLKEMMPTKTINAHHSRFLKDYEEAYSVNAIGMGFRSQEMIGTSEWQTLQALQKGYRGYLPKEIILEAVESDNPKVRAVKGRLNGRIIPLFNVHDVEKLHTDKPEVNPWRLYVDDNGVQWITPEGCTRALSKRFPRLLPEEVSESIRVLEETGLAVFQKAIGRVSIVNTDDLNARKGLTYMYKFDDIRQVLVPYLIKHL